MKEKLSLNVLPLLGSQMMECESPIMMKLTYLSAMTPDFVLLMLDIIMTIHQVYILAFKVVTIILCGQID